MDEFAPCQCNHATRRGTSDAVVWTITDPDGLPYDLTGVGVSSHARHGSPESPGPIALELGPEAHTVRADVGEVERELSPTQTLSLPAGDYFYELVLSFPSGEVEIAAWGYWTHGPSGLADGGN